MTSAVTIYEKPEDVRQEFTVIAPTLAEVLPAGVDPDRFVRIAVKAIIGNPKLMQCSRSSLMTAVMSAAELGLEPSGLLGSAYLVPYRNRKNIGGTWQTVMEAQLIPGYRGLIDLARRSGEILKIEARAVRLRDTFSLDYGRAQPVQHLPFIADPRHEPEERDPGPVVGYYMKAQLKGEPVPQVEWMSADEVEAIRRRSKAADDGPWVTDPIEMGRKTVVRRGSKYLPLTTDFRRALELDEEAERGAVAPDDAPAQLTPAQRLLQQRIEARHGAAATEGEGDGQPDPEGQQEGQPGTAEGEAAPGATTDQGAAPEQPTAEAGAPAPTGEACAAVNEQLGACGKAAGHTGAHGNDEGKWPQAKAEATK